jgi:hypothetical protein
MQSHRAAVEQLAQLLEPRHPSGASTPFSRTWVEVFVSTMVSPS